ncbi:MAG: VCBS repeat-containing protein [Pelobacteraceae bacterium]
MKLIVPVLMALLLCIAAPEASHAAPLKTHVAEFTVVGVPDSEALKVTLQGILTSRLTPSLVQLVEKPDQAEILVSGSYALFGTTFSLDALIKNRGDNSLTKVFEQGEGQENVIPAIGRLARKIDAELARKPATLAAATPAPPVPSPAAVPPGAKERHAIPSESSAQSSSGGWSSAPLDGEFVSMATGRTLPSGERELFLANERTIRAYLKGRELRQVAEITIPAPGKILAIDSADLDRDGTPELYVSIMDREFPGSRVYRFDGTAFALIADDQRWFFRGIGTDITSRTILVQEMAAGGTFYGDVRELVRAGNRFTTKNPQKLPRTGTIFNSLRVAGTAGSGYYVVLDGDGHLLLYSPGGAEVWKSSDSYGGSEKHFKHESLELLRSTGDQYRWTFLEQRITALKDGTLLVPHNTGTYTVGNNRSYNKHAMFAFEWNGAVLKEKWSTRPSPGYLADYAFDQDSGEVLQLEVVQRAGMFSKGRSVITTNRID